MSNRQIAVRTSTIHGRGVFALRAIPRGREIVRYTGALRTHAEVDAEAESGEDNGHTFLFTLNEKYVIDGGRGGNSARWINHGCEPNCEAFCMDSEDGDPRRDWVVIEARRDIAAGEELTYDYRIEPGERVTPALKSLWACRCGSPRCRGDMLRPRRQR